MSYREEFNKLLKLSYPVVFATLCRSLITSTDTAVLGHLGTQSLNGASLAQSYSNILGVIGWGPAYVLNSICSHAIGSNNPKLAGNWLQIALVASVILSLPICALYFMTGPVMRIAYSSSNATNSEEIHYAEQYNYIAWGIYPPQIIYMSLRQYFQAISVVHPASIVSLVTVFVNLGLNLVLVFGISSLGFHGLGIHGSALATLVSMIFQLVTFYMFAIFWKQYHKKFWGGWTFESFSRERVSRFLSLCGPMCIGICLENWGYSFMTLMTGRMHDKANVATHSVFYQLWFVLFSFYWGWGLALQVRVAKRLAAGRLDDVKRIIVISISIVFAIIMSVAVVLLTLRSEIPKMFSSDPNVLSLASQDMYILVLNYSVSCISLCGVNVLEATGQTKALMLIQSFFTWFVQFPSAYLLSFHCSAWKDKQLLGLWTGMLIGETSKAVAAWIVLYRSDWVTLSKDARERSEAEESSASLRSSLLEEEGEKSNVVD